MAFVGQETVRKRHRQTLYEVMFTSMAVYVHFNRFIDL